MPEESRLPSIFCFDPFELSTDTGELRKNGIRIKLFGQPIQVLTLLVGAPGQLVTREQLKEALWTKDTFTDFERGLNAAVSRLRENLGDSATEPRYIETVPGRGYRFIFHTERPITAKPDPSDSGAARADEGFWVAVLPFTFGGNPDLAALADGLSDDVVTGLSRFSYLHVIARTSTLQYANQAIDVRSVGKELSARYVMEGSLRQAGIKLRLTVQLVDAVSGAHLWAENYERTFSPNGMFELQDDLVPRIVSTVADGYGILPYSMANLVRAKAPEDLTPYEAFLRSYGYTSRLTPEEHAAVRTCLELAVQRSPDYGDAWAALSAVYCNEFVFGFDSQPDPLGRALQAARRAVESAPSNATAYAALACALFFLKDFQASRSAGERAISLNPMDGVILADIGGIRAHSGDWERGCTLVERAAQLNPRHPGWYLIPLFFNAYRKGDYREAVSLGLKFNINMQGLIAAHVVMAAAYGQLGESEAARKSLNEVLSVIPTYALFARARLSRWLAPELVEHLMDGLRKAGLELSDESAKSRPD